MAISLTGSESSSNSFGVLFADFSQTWAKSERGQEHFQKYLSARESAQANYEQLLAREKRGEDITDDALRLLLPHRDSSPNRARGAWVHVAPAVTKDVRTWFQNWLDVQESDWPRISRHIFDFVRGSVSDPSSLGQRCKDFSLEPEGKGIQTGMLSPILNALRPQEFLLVNNKSREVLNRFTGSAFSQKLAEYPETNKRLQEFVSANAAVLTTVGPDILVADVFDAFSHWLIGIRKHDFDSPDVEYWKIAPGSDAEFWPQWRDGNYIAIGWSELGDLTNVNREEFIRRRDDQTTRLTDWNGKAAEQAWRFRNIPAGSYVVVNQGKSKVLAIGVVTGPYEFMDSGAYKHRLPVEWLDLTTRSVAQPGWQRTLIELNRETFDAIQQSPAEPMDDVVSEEAGGPSEPFTIDDALDGLFIERAEFDSILTNLRRKRNIILQGPPGVGKTFVARRIAYALIGARDRAAVAMVQFHQSYAYEDFVQGYRPTESGTFQLQNGVFYDFCKSAANRPCAGSA